VLQQEQVAYYLLRRGLLEAQSIVEGDLQVIDGSQRNNNYFVICRRGRSYILKQGVGPDRAATIAHEAAVYRFLHSNASMSGLQRYLPRCYLYDSEEHILTLELSRDGENLRDYHQRRRRVPVRLAAALGQALATLHRITLPQGTDAGDYPRFSRQPAWILSLHRAGLSIFHDVSSANTQLTRIVQQSPEFSHHLDELRLQWRDEALVHFDMKWGNCIAFVPPGFSRKIGLKLVDWELASIGDPCWDVGSIFSEYLSRWLLSIPITGDEPPDRFLGLAQYPLREMQPAIRHFWRHYIARRELDAATSEELLFRSVRYGAARLVQAAFEQSQLSTRLTGNVVCLLQLSLNILRRPQEAANHLLGIA
jgi:hypothetical protein